ncbi:AlpA family transcriptional regulator [Rhodobacteraceae bacterium]|nr:AlpA family transcriptional regulator [Paracoccaceae bacterium]
MAKDLSIRLLRLRDVISTVGMKRSWILQKVNEGKFPKPIKLGDRANAWRESDIIEWIESRASIGDL